MVLFSLNSFAQVISWGDTAETKLDKKQVDNLIKVYVDKNYPLKVKEYKKYLATIKQNKLQKVSDTTFVYHNLMWQDIEKNSTKKYNHLEARVYCRKLKLAHRKDWRIPTYEELLELVDYTKFNPSSVDGLRYIVPKKYWSSSLDIKSKGKIWFVDFLYGKSSTIDKSSKIYLRCVRTLSTKKGDY